MHGHRADPAGHAQPLEQVVVRPGDRVQDLDLAEARPALVVEVLVPAGTTCCGMAGDRGMLHPELPASALRDVARELEGAELDACLSSNRTCEIALHEHTGRPYASFVLLLEELTRPRP